MKVLITGGAGFLGSTLIRKTPSGIDVHATVHENRSVADENSANYHDLDIRDREMVEKLVATLLPDVIIHTAAKGSPDYCEQNPDDSWDINVNGTRNLLEAAQKHNARIYAMSSNQVFDGSHGPFNEDSPLGPLNVYGKTKAQNEKDMQDFSNAYIVRPITMFGWANPQGQQNMAHSVINRLTKGETMNVTNDMFNNYLYVGQMADALWEMVQKKYTNKVINIAGDERSSLADFALKVARNFDLDTNLITPVPKSFFKDESPRPMDTSYDITLYKKTYQTPAFYLDEALQKMKNAQSSVTWKVI